ncbi:MAG: MerR family transcriptional regulator [Candidatus Dadabacteria bacterium]|nr:MAG: MerR family transcriptional regulator [Candidatus Dadabacteria bacterium]
MDLDVGQLAARTGVSVDTIRYYQSFGLLPPPARRGRRAFYSEEHVDRLERIRAMAARGFSLKAIRALLEAGDASESDRLLLAALAEQGTEPRYSRDELVERSGVPPEVMRAVERAGLAEAEAGPDGRPGYTDEDLRMARAATKLLEYGFPLRRLLAMAVRYDRAVRRLVDDSIELFDEHVRKAGDGDTEKVARAFRELLPVATALVAYHFQRRLVQRALKRLKRKGRRRELGRALKEASRARLRLEWR